MALITPLATEPLSNIFRASGWFFHTRSCSVGWTYTSPPATLLRTATKPSSTLTKVVPSRSSTDTSKTVPRTEMTAVGLETLLGFSTPGRCWI